MGMTVTEREVTWVVGHWMTLRFQSPTHITEREVCVGRLCHCQRFDAVALVLVSSSVESILQSHVGIEGIIAWAYLIFRDGIIERCRHLCFLREQLAQFQRGGYRVLLLGVSIALHHALLQTAEPISNITARHVHRSEV